jgi:hypothetical protein
MIVIAWGESILAVGPDRKICFYNTEGISLFKKTGKLIQSFDYTHSEDIADFNCADISPSGSCVALGSFDRFQIYLLQNTCV